MLFNPDIIENNLNGATLLDITSLDFENEFDIHYDLLAPEQTVFVCAYLDGSDDLVLAEIKPKYIVMCEPSQNFVRRIEVRRDVQYCLILYRWVDQVYRSSNPGLGVRVYFLV